MYTIYSFQFLSEKGEREREKMNKDRRRQIVLNACLNGKLSYLEKAFEDGHVDEEMMCEEIEKGKTPIFLAASAGNLNVVKFLIARIGGKEKKKCDDMMTPLHIACFNNHLKIARLLYSKLGYSLKSMDSRGYLPLHYACIGGHRDVVLWIRDVCGESSLELCTKSDVTPMDIATACGHLELQRTLRFFGSKDESLFPQMHAVSDHESQKEKLTGKKFLVHAMLKK